MQSNAFTKTSRSPRFSTDMSFFSKFKSSSSIDYIIVGLGNPGDQYRRTRHNCGFMSIDCIANNIPEEITFKKKFSAYTAECKLGSAKVLLMKPLTFMNNSGEAVSAAKRFYKLPPERVIVISDDASLPLGKIRIRANGSDGGQKGLRSIMLHLSTNNIPRIKVGIANQNIKDYDLASFVLGAFDVNEKEILDKVLPYAADAVKDIVNGMSIDDAMSKFNGVSVNQ